MCVHVCCPLIGMMAYRTELVPAYIRLLRDNEAEVRIAAAGKVAKFCDIVAPQVASQHILPCVKVCLPNAFSSECL
jgi:serine/threonine-protein phosphatase 2A regulatory subunit A